MSGNAIPGNGIWHTVLQKITGKNGFLLSLGVNNMKVDTTIRVLQNGKILLEKLRKANPAEIRILSIR